MDENLTTLIEEEIVEIPAEEVVEVEPTVEDLSDSADADEVDTDVEIEDIETIEVEVDEAIGWSGSNGISHRGLPDRNNSDQHIITSITGLREELNEIERLKTVYSDGVNVANYYKWEGGKAYDAYGYFVSLVPGTSTIEICGGSDIFGVSVNGAGFIGGQDAMVKRDNSYGLIATSGLVDVLCELEVSVGDYVVSNEQGRAKKSGSNYGYRVLAIENKDGVTYAVIALGVQADKTNAIGLSLSEVKEQVDANYKNIVSAVNVANQAYNKATDVDTSNKAMSDKVDGALAEVGEMSTTVENMGVQVSQAQVASAQAKAIAESAATSATSMKNEAVDKANEALAETSELRKEFEAKAAEIDTELDNTALELKATKESIETTRNSLQTNIDGISSELDDTKTDLNSTRNELSSEIDDVISSLEGTDKTIASITKRVGENETSIDSLTVWKDETSVVITDIEQKTDENSGSISILTAWKSDVEDDVESIASIKTQSDANKSSIESLTSWQGTASESLASVKQQSDANKASIDSITSWQGETEESIAVVKQQADDNEASIKTLTEWKDETSESIASIEQRVDGAESNISSLTSWQGDAKTSIANVEQKSNANESKINSLTSWQSEATESIANVEQKADANESAITNLTTWQGETNESIAAVKQTADQNSADISLIASWKSDVGDDVSSIASIKTTADENKAAIEQLVKKDTELSTTIAGVKTTADDNKASIEQITSWQSKVDPTINSVAGIKQTADGNAAKIEGLTTWQGETNIAMARIEQKADANGAYIQSTVSNMDKYAVGPYSQAYGFTLEQAASVLEEGMIYVPTENKIGENAETYSYTNDNGDAQTYTREFVKGYLYKWGKLTDYPYGWITVDKDYKETDETNTSSMAVYFTTTEPTVSDNFGYWYTNGDTITGTTGEYESYTLYKWESYVDENKATQYHWVAVATLAGNSSNRAVSQIRQDANSIELRVTNTEGSYAGLSANLKETQSDLQTLTSWTKDKDGNQYNLATIKQTADNAGASISQVVEAIGENGEVSAASIVTAVNDAGSSVVIDADHIQLDGVVSFVNTKTKALQNNAIYSSQVEYALSSKTDEFSAVSGNDGEWSTVAPTWRSDAYMWQRTAISKISGDYIPVDTWNAEGKEANKIYYANDTSYYWYYSDGWKSTTDPTTAGLTINTDYSNPTCIQGAKGETGTSINSTTVTYGVSDSSSTKPTSWSPTIPTVAEGKYLWTCTTIDYTDDDKEDTATYTYARQGADGYTPVKGEDYVDGTSVTVSSIQYQAGASATTAPTGTWSNSVVSVNEGQYLWSKTTFSDNNVVYGVAKQGVSGNSLQVKYINSATVPTITNNNVSAWSDTIPTVESGKRTYMTQKMSNTTNWSTPVQMSAVDGTTPTVAIDASTGYWVINGETSKVKAKGEDGNTPVITVGENGNWYVDGTDTGTKAQGPQGVDGDMVEYVYYRSNTAQTNLGAPSYTSGSLPSGWTTSPQGITETYKYEYMSLRTKTNETWSSFSTPVIWSKWGEKGQDGDGVSYKYYLNNSATAPTYSASDSKWTDEPTGVSESNQYEYVVQIKTTTSNGTTTSTPSGVALWAKWGQDGNDGQTPYVKDGNWWIDNTDTGVKAEGIDGGTPTVEINGNGYWVINGTATSVKALGVDGNDAPKVVSEEKQFHTSDSNITAPDSESTGWATVPMNYEKGKYLWARSVYTMDKGDPIKGDAYLDKNFTTISNWCKDNNEAYIDGANIYAGSITADQIDTKGLHAEYIEVKDANDNLVFKADTQNNEVYASSLSAISANLGELEAGTIDASKVTVKNLDADNITTGTIDADRLNIEIGGRNLAHPDFINHTATVNTDERYSWNITKDSAYLGTSINESIFEAGETYTLSFYFQKTDGTLKNIGGHTGGYTFLSQYIDNKATSGYGTGISMSDDTSRHYVVLTFKANKNATDNNFYIQPNRGDATSVTYNLWNIQVEKGNKATDWTPAPEDLGGWYVDGSGVYMKDADGNSVVGMHSGDVSYNSLVAPGETSPIRFYAGDRAETITSTISIPQNAGSGETYSCSFPQINLDGLYEVDEDTIDITSNEFTYAYAGSVIPAIIYGDTKYTYSKNETIVLGSVNITAVSFFPLNINNSYEYDEETGVITLKFSGTTTSATSIKLGAAISYSYKNAPTTEVEWSGNIPLGMTISGFGTYRGSGTMTCTATYKTRQFTALEDGSLYANAARMSGRIEASEGSIGNLEIQNGGLERIDNGTTVYSLNENGLIVNSANAKVQVGNVTLQYDNSEKATLLETSDALKIRGQNDTQLCFMANKGTSLVDSDITLYCRCISSGLTGSIFTGYIKVDTPCIYDYYIQVKCQYANQQEYITHEETCYFRIEANSQRDDYTFKYSADIFEGVTRKVRFLLNNESWSTWVTNDNIEDVEVGVVGHLNQKKANNYIEVRGHLIPEVTSTDEGIGYSLGMTTQQWDNIYARNTTILTSDREAKKDIEILSDPHEQIFDALQPVSYKFKVNNNNRTHTGFIAQDVKAAVEDAGLTTQDFAAYCEWENDDGTTSCGLRYGEFIALCVNEIQKLKKRVAELEEKLDNTK